MALTLEFSLDSRDRALLTDMAASLTAIASMAANLEKTVSAATDAFNANFAKFQSDFSTLSTDISNAISALQSGLGSNDDTAVQAAADQLATLDGQLTDMDSKLKAATPSSSSSPSTPSTPVGGSNAPIA